LNFQKCRHRRVHDARALELGPLPTRSLVERGEKGEKGKKKDKERKKERKKTKYERKKEKKKGQG